MKKKKMTGKKMTLLLFRFDSCFTAAFIQMIQKKNQRVWSLPASSRS